MKRLVSRALAKETDIFDTRDIDLAMLADATFNPIRKFINPREEDMPLPRFDVIISVQPSVCGRKVLYGYLIHKVYSCLVRILPLLSGLDSSN